MTKTKIVKLGFTLIIAAVAQIFIQEKTMTDLTLHRTHASASGFASLVQAVKEMFAATPLGLVLHALRG